jgi:hypothetical protein
VSERSREISLTISNWRIFFSVKPECLVCSYFCGGGGGGVCWSVVECGGGGGVWWSEEE